MAGAATPQENNSGCWAIAIIAGLILSVSYCSEKKDTESDSVASMAVAAPVDAAGEPVIDALSPSAITAGFEHFGKVARAEVEDGARIYSINCYASLAKTFSWATLDRCGGFDQAAVRTADLDTSYFADDELEYFGSESAAERYLGVGATAGLSGDETDTRLAALQKASADRRLPKRANVTAAPAVDSIAESTSDSPVMDEYTAEDELVGE